MPLETTPSILLVDDDKEFGKILSVFLGKIGVKLVSTTSATEFIENIKAQMPTLALIDLNLDGALAGFSLIKAIRNKFGDSLPIMVISANDEKSAISHALEVGANDFITKPIDRKVLSTKLALYLDKKLFPDDLNEYVKAPLKGVEAYIGFRAQIVSIDELGIRLVSSHLISKGAPISLTGAIIEEFFPNKRKILVSVISCEKDVSLDHYLIDAEYTELNQDEQACLRRSMAEKRSNGASQLTEKVTVIT